jgi:tetratricopeptide (TPR) repeat protein
LAPNLGLAVLLFSSLTSPFMLCAQSGAGNFESESALATSAREAGRSADAVRAYRAALEIRPDWDEGWWYLGTLNYDADQFPEAIPALRRFAELDPNVGPGWAFLGLSEFETAAYDDSFGHLQRARSLGFAEDPSVEKVAIYHLALLLNLRGDFEESARLLVSTFGTEHFPDQIKTALAMSLLRVPLLPAQVDPARDALLHAAGNIADLLAHQDLEGAGRAFQRMLIDFPQTPYLHYAYGMFLLANSEYEKAEAQFHEEGPITPQSAMAQIGLSSLTLKQGRIDDALQHAQKAVQIDPESPAAYSVLAAVQQQAKQTDKATVTTEQSRRLANGSAKTDPAQTKFYAVNHDVTTAGGPSTPSSASNTPASSAQDFEDIARQAQSAQKSNQLGDAIVLYQRAVQLRPSWQEGWRQLGTLLYMQRDYAGAASALKQAVAMDAKQADTWTLLGLCEFESRDYQNALLHLKKGQALGFGGNPAGVRYARYHLALLLNLESEFDAATDLLIPEAKPGPLQDEIQFAMGLALLRMPILPEQAASSKQPLIRTAGQAAFLLSESRYDSVFPIFEKLLQEYPDTPFLHYAYGDALAAVSEYDRAQIQLREETRNNPNSLVVYLRLAAIALRLNQSDEARDSAQKALGLSASSPDAHYLLGRSYLESGDVASAISELETARRLAPGSPAVHFNLARAYAKAKRPGEAEQERSEFERLNAQLSAQPQGPHSLEDRIGSAGDADKALAPAIAK